MTTSPSQVPPTRVQRGPKSAAVRLFFVSLFASPPSSAILTVSLVRVRGRIRVRREVRVFCTLSLQDNLKKTSEDTVCMHLLLLL